MIHQVLCIVTSNALTLPLQEFFLCACFSVKEWLQKFFSLPEFALRFRRCKLFLASIQPLQKRRFFAQHLEGYDFCGVSYLKHVCSCEFALVFFLSMENISAINLYGILYGHPMFFMLFKCCSLWNSCWLSILSYIWRLMFFQSSKFSIFLGFMPSFRVVDLFCCRSANFFYVFASFFSTCLEFLWGLWFLIVLSVVYKTGLYGSNG